MQRFATKTTELIATTRFGGGIRQHITVAAHEIMQLLVACHSLQDIGVIGTITRFAKTDGLYGLKVEGKWFVTFRWSKDFGAYQIRLERR
ncbi:plasmid maintenance system killer protein [Bradyrhizobium sp. JR1.5]|uniref:hypothetical protein n=1 Tax=unclassified Bradyrhizobium TaxID=2631580 RepID=UPI0024498621|nr:hypothetical protein [Bradyrhizobium sp. SSUT18]MDH2406347.1 hypothetical protein [Bradyrhizobium sp. SSUT18]